MLQSPRHEQILSFIARIRTVNELFRCVNLMPDGYINFDGEVSGVSMLVHLLIHGL